MAKETQRIDITETPELRRFVEQVQATQSPVVLQRDGEDLAILTPAPRKRQSPSKARPVTRDDALFTLIGIGRSSVPGGVSGKKHEHLVKAYRHR
jgi:hypothetical protein